MYTYSPIKCMRVRNFRNIGDVAIDFSESPIIVLTGENEAGKTSCTKAFAVCALNAYFRDQKDFIRDGTNGFGILIELADGTQITRIKTPLINRYNIQRGDDTLWDATKLESDTPKQVSDIMGLVEEPETKEFLQMRTYEDQLLFVVTPASTNYKVMYDALKISQITRAIKLGSNEANDLKYSITSTENSMYSLQRSMSAIKVFDIEPLLNLRNHLKAELETISKIDKAIELCNEIKRLKDQLGALSLLDSNNICSIDVSEANEINNIARIMQDINNLNRTKSSLSCIESLESIDENKLAKLTYALNIKNSVDELKRSNNSLVEVSKLEPVSEYLVSCLCKAESLSNMSRTYSNQIEIYKKANEINEISNRDISIIQVISKTIGINEYINNLKVNYQQIEDYNNSIINWLKSVGVKTIQCPKCGESIIVDNETDEIKI